MHKLKTKETSKLTHTQQQQNKQKNRYKPLVCVLASHIPVVAHWCAAHGALRCLLDAARHATIAAHIRQTSLEQNAPERAPKVFIEDGVNCRIQCRVHVPQPEGYREGHVRYVTARTRRLRDVQYEERQPTRYETAHNQTQNQCGTLLFLARNATLFLFGIARFHWLRRQRRLQFSQLNRLSLMQRCR